MLRVGFGFRTQVLCSVPSSCVCEAQLMYNWLLDASLSVLICLKVRNSVVDVVFQVSRRFDLLLDCRLSVQLFNSIDPFG